MSEKEQLALTLYVTPEEKQQIEALAHRRGFAETSDYLRALVEQDAKMGDETEDEDSEIDPVVSFRRGWEDVLAGRTHPISTLWDGIDDDE